MICFIFFLKKTLFSAVFDPRGSHLFCQNIWSKISKLSAYFHFTLGGREIKKLRLGLKRLLFSFQSGLSYLMYILEILEHKVLLKSESEQFADWFLNSLEKTFLCTHGWFGLQLSRLLSIHILLHGKSTTVDVCGGSH